MVAGGLILATQINSFLLRRFTSEQIIPVALAIQSLASALSMAPFAKNAGSASALMGGIQMGIGAFTSALVSMLSNGTAMPMTGVMACCAITSFAILMIGSRIIRYKASKESVAEESVDMICNS